MKNFKFFAAFVAVFAVCAFFVSCGNNKKPAPKEVTILVDSETDFTASIAVADLSKVERNGVLKNYNTTYFVLDGVKGDSVLWNSDGGVVVYAGNQKIKVAALEGFVPKDKGLYNKPTGKVKDAVQINGKIGKNNVTFWFFADCERTNSAYVNKKGEVADGKVKVTPVVIKNKTPEKVEKTVLETEVPAGAVVK